MPRVTALVCVRNHERFIGEAIGSVLDQGIDELVIYDDGSTDHSLTAAVSRWAELSARKRVPFLRVGGGPGRGIGAARNQALLLARGEYIAQLDADDIWLPTKIEKQMALLDGRRDALVVTLVEQFLDGVPCPPLLRPEMIGVPIRLPFPSNLLCHREVFRTIGGFDESLVAANDVDWFRRAFLGGIERLDVPEVLVRKRIHGENLSLHQGHDMVRQLIRVVSKRHA